MFFVSCRCQIQLIRTEETNENRDRPVLIVCLSRHCKVSVTELWL